jgi:tetratricopeptide (TPR) repeat protein
LKQDCEPDRSALKGVIAFTGRLASMRRAEAFEAVRAQGGTPREGVTRATELLVVGGLGWPLLANGRPSNSLAQARAQGIPIVSERRFLEWLGRAVPDEQARTFTAEQIARLSKLSPETVEQLSALGLIEAREGLFGFTDLAAARQLAELLGKGVPLSTITGSLHEIRRWLPDAHLSRLRLHADQDRLLVEQPHGRTDRQGQFMLPVEAAEDDADAAFAQAQAAEEAGDLATAETLYRRVMRLDPKDAAPAFNLGNILRQIGRIADAEAAYRRAVRADPAFAAGWHNLADLLDDNGRPAEAVECQQRAVAADSQYADAIFNLALLLQKLERHADAAVWWRRYLALDGNSPWAARARRALKYCEIQLAAS